MGRRETRKTAREMLNTRHKGEIQRLKKERSSATTSVEKKRIKKDIGTQKDIYKEKKRLTVPSRYGKSGVEQATHHSRKVITELESIAAKGAKPTQAKKESERSET